MSGVITLPVPGGMYQTMVANIQQIHTGSDGAVCVTPVVQVSAKLNNIFNRSHNVDNNLLLNMYVHSH